MKSLLAAVLLLTSFTAFAQSTPPSNGYWTVETSLKDKTYSIVSFYDNSNALIKRDTCNRYMDIKSHRVVKRLNKQLSNLRPAIVKR